MQGMWICRAYLCFSLFRADPTKGSPGSGDRSPTPGGPETQNVPRRQLRFCLYVVFHSLIVSCRPAAEKDDMIISPPWYTSGKFEYERKSDLPETAIR